MLSLTYPKPTRAHGWPASWKLLALSLGSFILFWLDAIWLQAAIFGFAIMLTASAGHAFLRATLLPLLMLWPVFAMLAAWHIITGAYCDGILVALRLINALIFANLVTLTTRLSDLMDVLRRLLIPLQKFGLPVERIDLAVGLAIRFTPLFILKGQGLSQAWRARSTRKLSWRIIFPFTLLALDDADHVSQALKARGAIAGRDPRN